MHAGIVKYGDPVTIKISTRIYINKEKENELEFKIIEDQTEEVMDQSIKIKIDAEGKGEANFTIPKEWENDHKTSAIPRYFYLKCGKAEFPRSYYIAKTQKGNEAIKEEKKNNSNRIRALMLKVAKDDILDGEMERVNAAVLGEELDWLKKDISSKKYKWAHSDFGNLLAKWESQNNYNLCNKTKGGLKVVRGLTLSDYTLSEIKEKQIKRDLFAVGRYQLIPSTLNQAVTFLNIKGSQKFDEELQDKIFDDYLIRVKRPKIIKYLEGNGTLEDAMHSTAKEWASVGVEKGKRISKKRVSVGGDSYYKGDGLNKAHISPEEIKESLVQSKKNAQ